MKRFFLLLFVTVFLFSSCSVPFSTETRSAEAILNAVLTEFSISDGFYYSDAEDAAHPLTDALLSRMFMGKRLDDLRYVRSMAVWFSRRYREGEIIVIELFDRSHQRAVMALLSTRAGQKENAVLFANGAYLYLVCTEQNDEIKAFLLS